MWVEPIPTHMNSNLFMLCYFVYVSAFYVIVSAFHLIVSALWEFL